MKIELNILSSCL